MLQHGTGQAVSRAIDLGPNGPHKGVADEERRSPLDDCYFEL